MLLVVTVACSIGVGLLVWAQLGSRVPGTTALDRIAYVGADDNIYTIDRSGENRLAITDDAGTTVPATGRLYRFPTWSPDNGWLAFVALEVEPGQPPENVLYAAPSAGGALRRLFTSPESEPFYLHWAPDGRQIAFLANERDGLSLRLAGLDRAASLLDTGSPFYLSWGPDSDWLLTHVGGSQSGSRIARLHVEEAQHDMLSEVPSAFQAPAWAPDGRQILFASRSATGDPTLYLADPLGEDRRPLVEYTGAISFGWSPQSDRVAYIVSDQPRPAELAQFAYGPIRVLAPDDGVPEVIAENNALAFFWSPDGRQIAYLTYEIGGPDLEGRQRGSLTTARLSTRQQQQSFRLRWHVVDLETGDDRSLTAFRPAPGFLSVVPFFDQYAQSLSVWSPDSVALAYSVSGGDAPPSVWVVAVDGRAPAQRLADGDFPAWSWH